VPVNLGTVKQYSNEEFDRKPASAGPEVTVSRFLVLASIIVVLFVLRRPDSVLNPQFWGEDGLVYFSQAFVDGPSSLFHSYNGAVWALPRILALVVTLLPVLWAPFLFNCLALVINAACCSLFSLPSYRHIIRSDGLRIACCLLFATALTAGQEMIGTLTNMPHYLELAAVGAVVLRAEEVAKMRDRSVAWIGVVAVLCAMSSPGVIAVAPIVLWQIYQAARVRNWRMFIVLGSLFGGILIQAVVDFSLRVPNSGSATLFPNFPMAMLFVGVLRWLLGEGVAKALAAQRMLTTAAAAFVLIAFWAVLLCRRLKTTYLLSAAVLFVGPVAMAVIWRHIVWATWTQVLLWGGDRYFFLPGCVFICLAAAWIDSFPNVKFSPIALVLPFALGLAGNFKVPPYPDFNWPSEALRIRQWLVTGCEVLVPVPPGWAQWVIHLPNLVSPEESSCGWLQSKAVQKVQVGPVIHISGWQADPEWTLNGFHPSVGTLNGEVMYGSFSGSDANRGTLVSSPFETGSRGCIVLPIAHGPSIVGQSVKLVAADTGQDAGRIRLDESSGNWRYWAVYFSRDISALRIVAEDKGDQWGQWVAVGEPHRCAAE
jgi:hypothetical protein